MTPAPAERIACSSRGVNRRQKSLRMAPCMSATIACRLFLHTSGKWPSSLTIPPRCPPMPSAHVLQAFFERIARQSLSTPPASRAFRQVYQTAGQPPPDLTFFMIDCARE